MQDAEERIERSIELGGISMGEALKIASILTEKEIDVTIDIKTRSKSSDKEALASVRWHSHEDNDDNHYLDVIEAISKTVLKK